MHGRCWLAWARPEHGGHGADSNSGSNDLACTGRIADGPWVGRLTFQHEQGRAAALVREYVGNAADEPAARKLAAIAADKDLRFAWWGPVDDLKQRFMYRLAWPSILIEFVREPTRDGGPANHVHAIVRGPVNDYGGDWLGRHYVEDHRP
ncbi:MAG: DUF3500 domain-containing protein [Sandaracinobacter sp.]